MASQEVLTALDSLHRELEKLEPAIKHVETAQQVTQTVKGIPQKHIELLKEIKINDEKHKSELKELFSKELLSLANDNRKLQKSNTDLQQQIKAEQEALSKLKDTVQAFHEKIEKINFPERLDKLDANISGIMSAIQSVQTRMENVERNITDRLKDLSEYQKESRTQLQGNMEQVKVIINNSIVSAAKKQQLLTYTTWFLIFMAVLIIKFIKIKL